MKYIKPIYIYNDIFRENFYIYYGTPVKETLESIKFNTGYNDIKDIGKTIDGKCFTLSKPITVIWTRRKSISTLVHECFHATFNMLGSRNINCNQETDEIFAYNLESLIRLILKTR